MKRVVTLLLLLAVAGQPLAAQDSGAPGRFPRKWLMTGVGILVTGALAYVYTSGNETPNQGGCSSRRCVVPVTIGGGAFLGFLIGNEMDHLYSLRYAHAPPLSLSGTELPLTLTGNDLHVQPRSVLVAGEGGVEVIRTDGRMTQMGVRARGLRGIGSVAEDSATNTLLVGTGVGLYRFPLTGDEAGSLAHSGEVSATSTDGSRVAVGLGTAFQIAALGDSLQFLGDSVEEESRVVDMLWRGTDQLVVLTEDRLATYSVDSAGSAALLGADTLPATGRRLSQEDTVVLVAAGTGGVFAVSVADPAQPRTLANWSGARFAYDAALLYGRAYVAAGPEGLYVLQLTPERFVPKGLARDVGFVAAVDSDGKAIYLLDRTGGYIRRIPVEDKR